MKVCFVSGYYSDLAARQKKRPEDYWNALFYVWAVKVGSHKKDFYIINRDGKRIQVTKKNFEIARTSFGKFVEARVQDQGWNQAPLLVPVPSKDALPGVATSRSLQMVTEAMASTPLSGAICDALRWTKQLPKAHEGGERRRDLLKPLMTVVEPVANRNVVLIDDLLSRGGTMLASKEKLEEAGATILGAVAAGRTIYDFETKPFGRQEFVLTEEADDFSKLTSR